MPKTWDGTVFFGVFWVFWGVFWVFLGVIGCFLGVSTGGNLVNTKTWGDVFFFFLGGGCFLRKVF